MRNWLETPGWSTSWIALAKMAARISRSVNTAWKKRTKHTGGGGRVLMRESNRWTKISLQVRVIDWTLSRSLIEADCGSVGCLFVRTCICLCLCVSVFICFVCVCTCASPRGRGWIAAHELTGWRQQHECCYGRPHRHDNGLLRSSGML